MIRRTFLKELPLTIYGISTLGLISCQNRQKGDSPAKKTVSSDHTYYQLARGRGIGFLKPAPDKSAEEKTALIKAINNQEEWKTDQTLRLVFDEKTLAKNKPAGELIRDTMIWQTESRPLGVQIIVSERLYEVIRKYKTLDHWAYEMEVAHENKTYPYKLIVPRHLPSSVEYYDFSRTRFIQKQRYGKVIQSNLQFENAAAYQKAEAALDKSEVFVIQDYLYLNHFLDFLAVGPFFYISEALRNEIVASSFTVDTHPLPKLVPAGIITFKRIIV